MRGAEREVEERAENGRGTLFSARKGSPAPLPKNSIILMPKSSFTADLRVFFKKAPTYRKQAIKPILGRGTACRAPTRIIPIGYTASPQEI